MCLYPPPTRSAFESAVNTATGMRTAAVYAAVSARMDRPLDGQSFQNVNDETAIAAYNAEAEFPSIKAMSPYIKVLANARQTRLSIESTGGNNSPRFKSSEPPSIVEDVEAEEFVNVNNNDAWTTIFGPKRSLSLASRCAGDLSSRRYRKRRLARGHRWFISSRNVVRRCPSL